MTYGAIYTVTYRTAVNRPWTKTAQLRFCGTDGQLAMFRPDVACSGPDKPFGLTLDRIVEIHEA